MGPWLGGDGLPNNSGLRSASDAALSAGSRVNYNVTVHVTGFALRRVLYLSACYEAMTHIGDLHR